MGLAVGVEAVRDQNLYGLAFQLGGPRAERFDVEFRQSPAPSENEISSEIGEQLAKRRQMARETRDDHPRDCELLGDQKHMHRPGAAEAQQHEVARIEAAVDRNLAHRAGHLGNRDADHAVGHVEDFVAVEPAIGTLGQGARQHEAARQRAPRRQTPEEKVGIRYRGLGATALIARRSRHGAGAPWSHLQCAVLLDPRDRTATGADGVDIELRHLQRVGVDLVGV